MASNCPYWKDGKCNLPHATSVHPCSYLQADYVNCDKHQYATATSTVAGTAEASVNADAPPMDSAGSVTLPVHAAGGMHCPNCGAAVEGEADPLKEPAICPACQARALSVYSEASATPDVPGRETSEPSLDQATQSLLSRLGKPASSDVDILNELIALEPKGIPVSEFLRLLDDSPPPMPPSGAQPFLVVSAIQSRKGYFLRQGSVCQLFAVAAPRNADIESALGRVLTETSAAITIADPKVTALVRCLGCSDLDATRLLCRKHACTAMVAIGVFDAAQAGQVLGCTGADKLEYLLLVSSGADAIKRKIIENAQVLVEKERREKARQEAEKSRDAAKQAESIAHHRRGGSSGILGAVIGIGLVISGIGVCDEGFWRYLWVILGLLVVLGSLLDANRAD